MGAQIISVGIYFHLKNEGQTTFADLSYFEQEEHIATEGNDGDCSHWAWQLAEFGLALDSFEIAPYLKKRQAKFIKDGPEKIEMALKALRQPEVQKYFTVQPTEKDLLPPGFESGYLCVHVRRGDYVNVASHLVAEEEFPRLAKKFSRLVGNIAIVSDSPLDEPFRNALSAGYDQSVFLDSISAFESHCIMRQAPILICSNSQFSLIAALLNPSALVLLPKQWFGGKPRAIEEPIHDLCGFQLLDGD